MFVIFQFVIICLTFDGTYALNIILFMYIKIKTLLSYLWFLFNNFSLSLFRTVCLNKTLWQTIIIHIPIVKIFWSYDPLHILNTTTPTTFIFYNKVIITQYHHVFHKLHTTSLLLNVYSSTAMYILCAKQNSISDIFM